MRSIIHYTNPRSTSLLPSFGFAAAVRGPGLESEIDRLFETALSGFAAPAFDNHFPVDLYEDKDNTYVRAELPGVNRDDINVEMVDGYLTINATRKSLAGEGKGEESFSFSRSVSIPENVHARQGQRHLRERRPYGHAAKAGGGQAEEDRHHGEITAQNSNPEHITETQTSEVLPCHSFKIWFHHSPVCRPAARAAASATTSRGEAPL